MAGDVKQRLADDVKAAIEGYAALHASNVEVMSLKTAHDIDTDVSKVRVELTFDV